MTSRLAGVFDPGDPASAHRRVSEAFAGDAQPTRRLAGPLAIAGAAPLEPDADIVSAFTGYLTSGRLTDVVDGLGASRARDSVRQLRGAFVLSVWDERRRAGVIAVDHLGAGGLFYCSSGRRLVFASELRDLLRLVPVTPAPDEDALARWLANGPLALGQTLYAGVRRLPGGTVIELGPDAWREEAYWRPTPPARPRTGGDAETVRAAATTAIRSRLDDGASTGLLMSGGLDSSSVAALARASGAGLKGYSAVFPEEPAMDESALVELVAGALGIPLTKLAVSGGSMLVPSLAYLDEWCVPSLSPNLLFAVPLVRAGAADGIATMLDGEGGDELFGFSAYAFADLIRRGRVVEAARLAGRLPGMADQPRAKALRWVLKEWGVKGALPYAAHDAARRLRPARYGAPWLRPAVAAELGRHVDEWRWKKLHGPRWWASLVTELTEGRQRFGAHDFLRHKSALGGVDGRHPYLDDVDLTETVLSLPPDAAFDQVHDRPLLRRATAGLLPDEVRLRRGKSYFDALFHRALVSTDRTALLQLLDADAAVGEYVRIDVVRSYLDDASTRPTTWRWVVWRAATAECWLRSLEDPSFPSRAAAEWAPESVRLGSASAGASP